MPTHYPGNATERRALDLFIKLMRASNALGERTAVPAEAAGLYGSQFGALEALYHLGPMKISELADKQLKSRNNFTVVVDNLEKQGLVRRERDHKDRRVVMVYLTEQGSELISATFPKFLTGLVQEVGVLTTDEQEHLAQLLKKLGTGRSQ